MATRLSRTVGRAPAGRNRVKKFATRSFNHQAIAEYIPFEEFRIRLPYGRFRGVVNQALALTGPGIALPLPGHAVWPWWPRGVLLRRSIKSQAPRLLLHLASRLLSVYEQATEHGVVEGRRA